MLAASCTAEQQCSCFHSKDASLEEATLRRDELAAECATLGEDVVLGAAGCGRDTGVRFSARISLRGDNVGQYLDVCGC